MIEIDVICPVYKSFENIKSLIDSLKCQKDVSIKKIVCSLTASDEVPFSAKPCAYYEKISLTDSGVYKLKINLFVISL